MILLFITYCVQCKQEIQLPKLQSPIFPKSQKDLRSETKVLARLRHDNVVQYYDFFERKWVVTIKTQIENM